MMQCYGPTQGTSPEEEHVTTKQRSLESKPRKSDKVLRVSERVSVEVPRSDKQGAMEESIANWFEEIQVEEEKGLVLMIGNTPVEGRMNGPNDLYPLIRWAQSSQDKTWALNVSRKPKDTIHNISLANQFTGCIKKKVLRGRSSAKSKRNAINQNSSLMKSSFVEAKTSNSNTTSNSSHPRRNAEFKRWSPAKFQVNMNKGISFRCDEEYRSKHRWRFKQFRLLLMDDDE